MDERDEIILAEAARWQELDELLGHLPLERMEDPTLNAEGWSVKDLLWHLAYWCVDAERAFVAIRAGTFEPRNEPEATPWFDPINDAELERSRAMTLEEVRGAWLGARTAMLERFGELTEPSAQANGRLAECGPSHYADHLPELRAFLTPAGG